MATKTEKYQLISGKHASGKLNADGTEIVNKPGDWLDLTLEQARSFGNKVKSKRVLDAELASLQAHEALARDIDEANAELNADETLEPKAPAGLDTESESGGPENNPKVTTGVTAPSTATQTTGAVGKPDPAKQPTPTPTK